MKFSPTCFGLRPPSGSLRLSLAKVTLIKVLLPTAFINVTLARLKCKLPDYGHKPKHVGAISI